MSQSSTPIYSAPRSRNLGQVDLVVMPMQDPVHLIKSRLIVRAPHRFGADDLVRRRGQRSPAAHTSYAARARAVAFALVRPVRLLAPRRRQAGVVRRLRRPSGLCFQLCHTCRQCLDLCGQQLNLRPQCPDQRTPLVVRQLAEIRKRGHPSFESQSPPSRQAASRNLTHDSSQGGVEQIPMKPDRPK